MLIRARAMGVVLGSVRRRRIARYGSGFPGEVPEAVVH